MIQITEMEIAMKLLTVTIPSYNSQEYMRHAIESVLVGGEDIEILIVDDGSSDNTLSIAQDMNRNFLRLYERFTKKTEDMDRLSIPVFKTQPDCSSKY